MAGEFGYPTLPTDSSSDLLQPYRTPTDYAPSDSLGRLDEYIRREAIRSANKPKTVTQERVEDVLSQYRQEYAKSASLSGQVPTQTEEAYLLDQIVNRGGHVPPEVLDKIVTAVYGQENPIPDIGSRAMTQTAPRPLKTNWLLDRYGEGNIVRSLSNYLDIASRGAVAKGLASLSTVVGGDHTTLTGQTVTEFAETQPVREVLANVQQTRQAQYQKDFRDEVAGEQEERIRQTAARGVQIEDALPPRIPESGTGVASLQGPEVPLEPLLEYQADREALAQQGEQLQQQDSGPVIEGLKSGADYLETVYSSAIQGDFKPLKTLTEESLTMAPGMVVGGAVFQKALQGVSKLGNLYKASRVAKGAQKAKILSTAERETQALAQAIVREPKLAKRIIEGTTELAAETGMEMMVQYGRGKKYESYEDFIQALAEEGVTDVVSPLRFPVLARMAYDRLTNKVSGRLTPEEFEEFQQAVSFEGQGAKENFAQRTDAPYMAREMLTAQRTQPGAGMTYSTDAETVFGTQEAEGYSGNEQLAVGGYTEGRDITVTPVGDVGTVRMESARRMLEDRSTEAPVKLARKWAEKAVKKYEEDTGKQAPVTGETLVATYLAERSGADTGYVPAMEMVSKAAMPPRLEAALLKQMGTKAQGKSSAPVIQPEVKKAPKTRNMGKVFSKERKSILETYRDPKKSVTRIVGLDKGGKVVMEGAATTGQSTTSQLFEGNTEAAKKRSAVKWLRGLNRRGVTEIVTVQNRPGATSGTNQSVDIQSTEETRRLIRWASRQLGIPAPKMKESIVITADGAYDIYSRKRTSVKDTTIKGTPVSKSRKSLKQGEALTELRDVSGKSVGAFRVRSQDLEKAPHRVMSTVVKKAAESGATNVTMSVKKSPDGSVERAVVESLKKSKGGSGSITVNILDEKGSVSEEVQVYNWGSPRARVEIRGPKYRRLYNLKSLQTWDSGVLGLDATLSPEMASSQDPSVSGLFDPNTDRASFAEAFVDLMLNNRHALYQTLDVVGKARNLNMEKSKAYLTTSDKRAAYTIKTMWERFLKPISETLAKDPSLDYADFEDFLYARHAPDYNRARVLELLTEKLQKMGVSLEDTVTLGKAAIKVAAQQQARVSELEKTLSEAQSELRGIRHAIDDKLHRKLPEGVKVPRALSEKSVAQLRARERQLIAREARVKVLLEQASRLRDNKIRAILRKRKEYVEATQDIQQTVEDALTTDWWKGSGISNMEAAELMQKFKEEGTFEKYRALATHIDKMNQFKNEELINAGVRSQKAVDYLDEKYPYYVNLRGIADDKATQARIAGRIRDRVGKSVIKKGEGRTTKASDVLSNTVSAAYEAILSAQDNRVRRIIGAALGQISDLQDVPFKILSPKDVNVVKSDGTKVTLDYLTGRPDAVPTDTDQAVFMDGSTEKTAVKFPAQITEQNSFKYYIDGEPYTVLMATDTKDGKQTHVEMQRLLYAIRGGRTFPGAQSAPLKILRGLTRSIAALKTSKSPVFWITNMVKDTGGGTAYALANFGPEVTAQTLARMPAMAKALTMREAGVKSGFKYSKELELWEANGGRMEVMSQVDSDTIKSTIEKNIKDLQKAGNSLAKTTDAVGKVAFSVFNTLEVINTVVESQFRASLFVGLVSKGMDPVTAAAHSNSVTIDFGMKGNIAQYANTMAMFFNAAMQGASVFFKLLTSPKTRKAFVSLQMATVGMGYLLSMWNHSVMDGEDEQPWLDSDGFSHWHTMTIAFPYGREKNDGKKWSKISIPVQYLFNTGLNTGTLLHQATSDRIGYGTAILKAMRIFLEDLDPMGVADAPFALADGDPQVAFSRMVELVTPAPFDPIIQAGTNVNFFGASIWQEGKRTLPRALSGRKSTDTAYKDFAVGLKNFTSGGALPYEEGGVDVYPEIYQHLLQEYGGGWAHMMTWLFKVTDPENRKKYESDIDALLTAPGLRTFASDPRKVAAFKYARKFQDIMARLDNYQNYMNWVEKNFKKDIVRKAVDGELLTTEDTKDVAAEMGKEFVSEKLRALQTFLPEIKTHEAYKKYQDTMRKLEIAGGTETRDNLTYATGVMAKYLEQWYSKTEESRKARRKLTEGLDFTDPNLDKNNPKLKQLEKLIERDLKLREEALSKGYEELSQAMETKEVFESLVKELNNTETEQ